MKRSRVSGRPTSRPRPARPSGSVPAPVKRAAEEPTPAASLTEAEAQRAAELEAQLVTQEKTAARARAAAIARRRGLGPDTESAGYNQPLGARAAVEYGYVARDVRRIGLTAALMLAILFALAFAINVAGIIKI